MASQKEKKKKKTSSRCEVISFPESTDTPVGLYLGTLLLSSPSLLFILIALKINKCLHCSIFLKLF